MYTIRTETGRIGTRGAGVRRTVLALGLAVLACRASAAPTVTSIEVRGNRVRETVVRECLAFREGGTIDAAKIERSRQNLYDLSLFRTLDITTHEDGDGVRVVVDARDGWFLLPWPFAGSQAGEEYAGGLLVERNLFRRAESLVAFGMFQQKQSAAFLMFLLDDYSINVGTMRASYDEYRYSDGTYNSTALIGANAATAARYGDVAGTTAPGYEGGRVEFIRDLEDGLSAGAEVRAAGLRDRGTAGALPTDEGDIRSLRLFVFAGEKEDFRREIASSFGRIFGLGMADMAENFKKVESDSTRYGIDVSFEAAHEAFGSDFDFYKAIIVARRVTDYRDRSGTTFTLTVGHGSGLPGEELFATNREYGMHGVYAREVRGENLALAGARYRHPLVRNGIGQLNGEFFLEYGTCFSGGGRGRTGAGAVLVMQLWRFPLPLGFGYAWSVDDADSQFTFSIGGMI